ncbi:MAG: tetratricopeptide repeat protein, partial [Acidobacteria bacterium]
MSLVNAWTSQLLFVAMLLAVGCGGGGTEDPSDTVWLEPVAYPDLAGLEERVRDQLDSVHANLERVRAESEVTEAALGRAYGEAGMVYQAYNLHDTAASCYRNAARLEPDEFRWHYYLGHLHHDEGQEDDARVSLNRSLALRPGDIPATLLLARIEFESNRLDRAESLYRSILAAAAENPGALFGLGKTAVARKDYAVAVEHLEHARRRAPQATEIHYPLSLAYRGLGDAERALEHLEQRGDVPPPQDDPLLGVLVALAGGMRVHQLRGTALAQEGHYAEALTEFRRAVESDPDEPLVRINLALTWIEFGDFSAARRELNAALALAPDDAFAHYNLGTLEAQLGRDERAVEHLTAALRTDPNQRQARVNLANALHRLGRPAAALPHYRHAVESDPGNAAARLGEARALVAAGHHAEARRRLEEATAARPEDRALRHALIRVLAASPDAAVRDGRRAFELARSRATPQMSIEEVEMMAMVAAESRMFADAVRLQRQAVESARSVGRYDLVVALEENLQLYERREACRRPWRDPATGGGDADVPGLLRRIVAEADPDRNPFLNDRRAERLAAKVAEAAAGNARDGIEFELAHELLRAGDTRKAIELLESLIARLVAHGSSADAMLGVREVRALAYLRLGEQENCVARHGPDSCLLPIRPGAVHVRPDGSRRAAELYAELLENDPGNLGWRWLLNLAHMTLGGYPDDVPARWLIAPEAFRSEYELPRFANVATALGLDVNGLSGGSILEDFDGDGLLDVIVSAWGLDDSMHYFRNNGDGTFAERTEAAGLGGQRGGLNISHADYDNDGNPDVLVLRGGWLAADGEHPNSLLRNLGGGVFRDVTREAGLFSLHPTQAAAWADYDLDGNLDLFVGNENTPGKSHPSQLYLNNGDGTFSDVAAELGIRDLGFVKAAAWGDYNNDGWPDLYLSRYLQPNLLLRNEGPGEGGWRFTDVTAEAGVAEPKFSFPTWFFDYDNDGWLDLLVASFADFFGDSLEQVVAGYLGRPAEQHSRLYRNRGDGTFEDVTVEAGLDDMLLAMGANFGDLDNDGWLDCYFGTGLPRMNTLVPNRMYRNDRGLRFQDVTTAGGFGHLQKGHGIAFGDLDNDGDQDIYAVMGGAFSGDTFPNALFLNPGNENHWITLRLTGRRANRSAFGARIVVTVEGGTGTRRIHRTVGTGGSFGSSSLQQEIGLGDARAIRSIEIRWPTRDGFVQRIGPLPLDRFVEIDEGAEP